MKPLRLVIFDDNNDFRESLLHLFRFTPDVDVVGAYADCSNVQDAIQSLKPEVVLMDIDMPGINGIEATALLKVVAPEVQVVMLTVSEEEERIFQALRNGATGYMLKRSGPDELVEGVRSVVQGGSPMSPAIARKVLQFFHFNENGKQAANSIPKPMEPEESLATGLTPREQEILEALVDGLSYKMIAAKHFISTDTVKNHIQGIYRKLHVNSKGEAISLALKKGIAGQRL
ncbi:MAG: response regulator transcription factor [Saprospiraceae bacterium]|nr:response regulator transcription factor [Saprospiraceae bacterium]